MLRIELFLRFVHAMILWVVIYFVAKSYQQQYLETSVIKEETPPRLWTFPITVIVADAALYLVIVGMMLYVLKTIHGAPGAPPNGSADGGGGVFAIDDAFLKGFVLHYALFAALFIVIGMLYIRVIKHKQTFHYVYDGMRGIRSLSVLLFLTAVALLATIWF